MVKIELLLSFNWPQPLDTALMREIFLEELADILCAIETGKRGKKITEKLIVDVNRFVTGRWKIDYKKKYKFDLPDEEGCS